MNLAVDPRPLVCSVEGCYRTDRIRSGGGYCNKHYEQWRRTGSPVTQLRPTFLERLVEKVNPLDTGCWEWTAYRNPMGYGQVGFGGRVVLAHRAVYEVLVRPIPDGLTLDHLCRNPGCVNPDHLEPVTTQENSRRGDHSRNGADQRAKTHCPQGHPYDLANTGYTGGSRRCRACGRLKARARFKARKLMAST